MTADNKQGMFSLVSQSPLSFMSIRQRAAVIEGFMENVTSFCLLFDVPLLHYIAGENNGIVPNENNPLFPKGQEEGPGKTPCPPDPVAMMVYKCH